MIKNKRKESDAYLADAKLARNGDLGLTFRYHHQGPKHRVYTEHIMNINIWTLLARLDEVRKQQDQHITAAQALRGRLG